MLKSNFQIKIPNVEEIRGCEMVMIPIEKQEVRRKNFDRFDHLFHRFERCGSDAKGKLMLTFSYDDVPYEIYEIPEIRDYMLSLVRRHPNLFYFITNEQSNREVLISCLGNSTIEKHTGVITDFAYITAILPVNIKSLIIFGWTKYALSIGEPLKGIEKDISSFLQL